MSFHVRTVEAPRAERPTVDLTARLGGLLLPNPVLTASGCAAAGRELGQFFDVGELGAVVTKSIMLAPRSGRATPRMAETTGGMLNSIGLQGPGIDGFLEHDLPWLHEQGARAVVSISRGGARPSAAPARTPCRGCTSRAPAPSSRSPVAASRSTPSWPAGCAVRPA